uniref:EF-hand domain-containing protein n=1 Tax=Callorhinchus milii TaxID=7868 RepID=A0A4W3H421_CALMI
MDEFCEPVASVSEEAKQEGLSEIQKKGASLTKHQREAFKELFNLFSVAHTDGLTRFDLSLGLQAVGIKLSEDKLAELAQTLDLDRDGQVGFEDFLEFSRDLLGRLLIFLSCQPPQSFCTQLEIALLGCSPITIKPQGPEKSCFTYLHPQDNVESCSVTKWLDRSPCKQARGPGFDSQPAQRVRAEP